MKTIGLFSLLLTLFTACNFTHEVYLKSDGTASIKTYLGVDSLGFMKQLQESAVISELQTDPQNIYVLTFQVNDIDSIGNFIPYFHPGFINFKKVDEGIKIRTADIVPYSERKPNPFSFSLRIQTEEAMEATKANGKSLRYRQGKNAEGFWLTRGPGKLKKGKQKIELLLKPKTE